MKSIERIKIRAKRSRNDDFHDRCFALQLFMSGDFDFINTAVQRYSEGRHGDSDLGDYPLIIPDLATDDGMIGLQNHSLVNSRINVQGVVHVKPEFHWLVDDPMIKEYNGAWIRQNAEMNAWGDEFYLAGLEVEANGIGGCEWGIAPQTGTVACRHRPVLDTLFDPQLSTPSAWRYVFHRQRIDVDESLERYGHLFDEDELSKVLKGPREMRKSRRRIVDDERSLLHEWTYWDNETCLIFLGSINGKNLLVGYDDNGELVRCDEKEDAPDNPYGSVIPSAWWIDSYAPGVQMPVGKTETVMRIAMMLNEVEDYMVQIVRRGIPLMGVDTTRIDADIAEKLRGAKGSKDILKIFMLTGAGSMNEIFSRLEPFEVPATVLQLRQMLKEELNAATGVMDMQRGQALGGERRTRFEVNALLDQQGIQARHFRERFCRFLEKGVQVARHLGANFRTADMLLFTEEGIIPTESFPPQPMLSLPLIVHADPSSLYYKSEETMRQETLELWPIIEAGLASGVQDPWKTFYAIYKKLGYRDPLAFGMYDQVSYEKNLAMRRAQEQMALMAQGQQENASSR